MQLSQNLNTPGEHPFLYPGLAGPLEGVLTVPDPINKHYIAMIGHPHSLHGGTMNNKVITTLVRAFKELHIASIRFNFRGVGNSAGQFDDGIGESEDMLRLTQQWQQELPTTQFIFAGFSFGSYVAYRAAAQHRHALLISIAPPVHHYNFNEFNPIPSPWVILQGDEDEIIPLQLVRDFVSHSPSIKLIRFPQTTHFFHGQLIHLKERLIELISAQVAG